MDIGGGFPVPYPGFSVPPLADYFDTIAADMAGLPLAEGGEILGESGPEHERREIHHGQRVDQGEPEELEEVGGYSGAVGKLCLLLALL